MSGAPRYHDHTGRTFGSWRVLHRVPGRTLSGKVRWYCRCTCGNVRPVLAFSLTSGDSTQCKSCAVRKLNDKRWKRN